MIPKLVTIKNQWRYFLTAMQFFTRIPVNINNFNLTDLNKSTRFFPLIGIMVGGVGATVFYVVNQFLPLSLAVLISMMATILLTGAFHEDGLADAVDGLGGGLSKEQALTIMTDSRVGSYGAIALVMVLISKHQALVEQSAHFIPVIIAGHALSRLCAVLVMHQQDYVKSEGKSKPLATKIKLHELLIAAFFGLLPLAFLLPHQLFSLIPVAVIWVWFSAKLKKRIGGYTGDCLGAMQQLTEVTFYFGLIATQELYLSMSI